jgi:hypothetical protein
MPDISPLVTCRANNQSLFAPNADDGAGNLQNFGQPSVTLTKNLTLNTVVGQTINSVAVPYDYTGNPSLPFLKVLAGLTYTASSTNGTVNFTLLLNGGTLQTISTTPSASAQAVNFDIERLLPQLSGPGTYSVVLAVDWAYTSGTINLAFSTTKQLTVLVTGYKQI